MATFNEYFIEQHREDSNFAANMANIEGQNASYSHKSPKTPESPFADGESPTFSDKILKNMCGFIQTAVSHIKKPRDKSQLSNHYGLLDISILTILAVSSAAFTKVRFLYRRTWYYPTLMILVIAIAGMGKGVMEGIFKLVEPINDLFSTRYKEMMKAYTDQQNLLASMSKEDRKNYREEILEKPSHLLFRIPTDSTYAAFIKALCNMMGMGAVLDTEIDTLVHSFAQDMGDYSVLIRKNFKHEYHDWYRKTEDEVGIIPEPKFSMALSGTLDQLKAFVNSVQNGFFSRILYYFYSARPVWVDAENENDCDEDDKSFFSNLGKQLLRIFLKLEALPEPIRFRLTDKQIKKLNTTFNTIHTNYVSIEGNEIHATVVRLAVCLQRIALMLTVLRLLDKDDAEIDEALKGDLTCSNKDFNSAVIIIQVLMQHGSGYYEMLQRREAEEIDDEVAEPADFGREDVNKGFESLPTNRKLTRDDIIKAMTDAGVPYSTADKYVIKFVKSLRLKKICHGQYRKYTDDEYLIVKKSATPKKPKTSKKERKTKS